MAPTIPRKNRSRPRLIHRLPGLSINWGPGIGIGILVLLTTDWRSASLYLLTWGPINALWQQWFTRLWIAPIRDDELPGTWTDEPLIPNRKAKLALLNLLISFLLPSLIGAYFGECL